MTKLFTHYLCGFDINLNLGMTFGNRRFQNPGIAKKKGKGLNHGTICLQIKFDIQRGEGKGSAKWGSHTAPQRCQPNWLGTLDLLLDSWYCDLVMTILVAR